MLGMGNITNLENKVGLFINIKKIKMRIFNDTNSTLVVLAKN